MIDGEMIEIHSQTICLPARSSNSAEIAGIMASAIWGVRAQVPSVKVNHSSSLDSLERAGATWSHVVGGQGRRLIYR